MACIKSTARGTGGGDVSGFVLPPQPVPAGHSILLLSEARQLVPQFQSAVTCYCWWTKFSTLSKKQEADNLIISRAKVTSFSHHFLV